MKKSGAVKKDQTDELKDTSDENKKLTIIFDIDQTLADHALLQGS